MGTSRAARRIKATRDGGADVQLAQSLCYYAVMKSWKEWFAPYVCKLLGHRRWDYFAPGAHMSTMRQRFPVEYCTRCGLTKEEMQNV